MKGLEYLRKKLDKHSYRVNYRYKHYDMKYQDPPVGITIPPSVEAIKASHVSFLLVICNDY